MVLWVSSLFRQSISDAWFHPMIYIRSSTALNTFSNTSNNSHVLAASTSNLELLLLNSMTGSIVRQTPTTSLITHLQFSHSFLLSGSSDGFLRIHDPRTGLRREEGVESLIKAHISGIQGLQCFGNFAFTIGWGMR